MVNAYIFYGHLEYFMEIWDIIWPFGTFCIRLVHFSGFGIMYQEKSGNPAPVYEPLQNVIDFRQRLPCVRRYAFSSLQMKVVLEA
jgi:hypothetical protein